MHREPPVAKEIEMDIFKAIAKRHSYRGAFLPKPVPREDLQRIVQAGILAPSGCNAQTTTFAIVDDPAILASIYEVLDRPGLRLPPALIVCIAEPRVVFQDMHFELEDCSAATENILLAVTALGYATVWIDGMLRMNGVAEKIGQILNIPADRQVQIILPIGVPAAPGKQPEKLPFAERAWFNRYEG
jgi:nitroreductase